jgi:cytosine/adenosine deaminase-related metal-dependent hydrolase
VEAPVTGAAWVLSGARVALGPKESEALDVSIERGRISQLGPGAAPSRSRRVEAEECLILPGLINAHDHLQYSLYPRLGHGPYPDAAAWARDIHRPAEPPIREQRRVSVSARLRWGGVKNLLGGATTVAHHDPYRRTFTRDFPVRVPRIGWAHSFDFTESVGTAYRRAPRRRPFVIHFGEASTPGDNHRLERLEREGALTGRTVLVHGVALDCADLALARRYGAGLVWCPTSNEFILGASLSRHALESGVRIALGTDSCLSGAGTLIDEIQAAARAGLSEERLYAAVTHDAAAMLRLHRGAGAVEERGAADLVVVADRGVTPAARLTGLREEEIDLVVVGGRIRLASPRLHRRLPGSLRRRLRALEVEGRVVWLDAHLPWIYREAAGVLGPDLRLAGRRVRVRP